MGLLRVGEETITRIDSCLLGLVVDTEGVEGTSRLLLLRRRGRAMKRSLEAVDTDMMLQLRRDKDCPVDLRLVGEVLDTRLLRVMFFGRVAKHIQSPALLGVAAMMKFSWLDLCPSTGTKKV